MNHDALSLSMFWAGALMVFTPLVAAGVVLAVWWYQKKKGQGPRAGKSTPAHPDP